MQDYLIDLIFEAMRRGAETDEDVLAFVTIHYQCTRQEFDQAMESVALELIQLCGIDEVHTIH